MSSSDPAAQASTVKWLSVIGIGESGIAGLGDDAKRHIAQAEIVFGGKRHLALAASLVRGEPRTWPSPFDSEMQAVRALRPCKVCILASGDPFLHGVGGTLARHIPADEMTVIAAPSAFSLAAARLGWVLQDIETISLHGRPVELIRPLLHPARRVFALTSDEKTPALLAALLTSSGFGPSRFIILEALDGPNERITSTTAKDFSLGAINPLNLIAIEVAAEVGACILPLTPGLQDAAFEHDGQITKREIRSVTLSALAPRRGELLVDIGAGAGSIAIEWLLADPSLRATAIEHQPERATRIRLNAVALGVPGLTVIEGRAPEALAGLPQPDAIFVGGGGSDPGVLEAAIGLLRSGGRLIANAVTLEMEALLLARHAEFGGTLTRIAISRSEPVGGMSGWRPMMPVTQWSWVKS